MALINAGDQVKNHDEGSLNQGDESNKDGIVIAISVAAAMIVCALLAIAVKIRRSKNL